MTRSVLLISTFNFDRRAWNGVLYEMVSAIAGIENATVVAPGTAALGLNVNGSLVETVLPVGHPLRERLRNFILMRTGGLFRPTAVEGEHDLCFFVAQHPRDLKNLRRVEGWRRRSRIAVAFILETWSSRLPKDARALKVLDAFDHVFVLNAGSAEQMRRHTRTPVSFLATGVDCLRTCPERDAPERVIDLLAIGRHMPEAHESMLGLARQRRLFYMFDTWHGLQARDWAQVRDSNAGLIQRSRYFVVWSPASHSEMASLARSEEALSTRYFEGAAGGAILIGSTCRAPEFDTFFEGPDAVLELAPDGSDFARVFDAIECDPERQRAIRMRNVVAALRGFDWSYRWETVLRKVGLAPTEAHLRRMAYLRRRADEIEAEAGGFLVRLGPAADGRSRPDTSSGRSPAGGVPRGGLPDGSYRIHSMTSG